MTDNNADNAANPDEQSLVIAIQTPHGSHLNIYHQKKAESQVPRSRGDFNAHAEHMVDTYHLEIDAETGREAMPAENIKIY